jgi:precorrin-6A/cobalt-precorrin-6A reductase
MPALNTPHVLILGGTTEAARLAASLSERFGARLAVTTSLAGRTRTPGSVVGAVRVGGFGGAPGLAAWCSENQVTFVIDATHPFANVISSNARRACDTVDIPRLMLVRAPWCAEAADDWRKVASLEAAAAILPDIGKRIFLSIGAAHLAGFAGLHGVHLVVRMIDPPGDALPLADYSVILDKGPFDAAAERELLQREQIDALVSRNSGGSATFAKIKAARSLKLPVVMVTSPAREDGERVESVEGALQWIADRIMNPKRAGL